MSDLISREALKKAIDDEFDLAFHNGNIMLMSKIVIVDRILAFIDNAPTVEPKQDEEIIATIYDKYMSCDGQIHNDTANKIIKLIKENASLKETNNE